MDILSKKHISKDVCAASQYAKYVDSQLNGAAIQEFQEATSALQEPGADLNEGSAFLDDTPITFTTQSAVCGLCKGVVKLCKEGSVEADLCQVSGYCELELARNRPEKYRDENGKLIVKEIKCRTETGCRAIIELVDHDGILEPLVKDEKCKVITRGANWRTEGEHSMENATLHDPRDGIEEFDGLDSGREE